MTTVLVTGASGFVGSAFIRWTLENRPEERLVGLVRNSDQKNLRRLTHSKVVGKALHEGRLRLVYGDLCGDITGICERVDVVVNFAARTFVDRSILSPLPFVQSNVVGTCNLLEEARKDRVKRYVQFSTDETLGAIREGSYVESAPINPSNPYSASKAGGDALAISYAHAFGLHTTVTRCENIYGPMQGVEKVFPTFVRKALAGEKLPLYGNGQHVRQWIWVEDTVLAVWQLLDSQYEAGQVFHVAGNQELKNIELAEKILNALEKVSVDHFKVGIWQDWIEYVDDSKLRPGHDFRYALDSTKLRNLGWQPQVEIDKGVERAVEWYSTQKWWTLG